MYNIAQNKTVSCTLSLLQPLILVSAILWGLTQTAAAQPSDTPLAHYWRPDGPIHSILVTNGTTYLGGAFGYVGPDSGGAGVIDLTSGEAKNGFPKIDGTVFATVSDGAGGWYIGGAFTNVGSVIRSNLAHILPDNSVDAKWTPHLNGTCRSMVSWGGQLYIGGTFTRVAGITRNRLAALDPVTGGVAAWNPNANNVVNVITLDAAGATLYVGGNFTTVGSSNRTRIAALNLATGFATAWNPGANQIVMTIAPVGNTIYAGGNFTTIGTLPRNRIAALDATTAAGLATDWNPNVLGGGVSNLVVGAGVVYAGGAFTSVSGLTRRGLAAIDLVTGLPTDWDPNPNTNVNSLVLVGDVLYAGGAFTNIGGADRRLIAALNLTNGAALPPVTAGSDLDLGVSPAVQVMGLAGDEMLIGGSFASIGGVLRNRIAALSNATGEATEWNPDASGTVSALVFAANTLYAGGSFTNIGGQPRNRLAALSDASGEATTWNPDVRGRSGVAVLALALSTDVLYAGGNVITNVGGLPRTNLFAVSLANGQPTTWNPRAFRSSTVGSVNTVVIDGESIVVGGDFVSINGQTRTNLAAVSASTGDVESWSPNPNGSVTSVVVLSNTVYAGGTFTSIGSILRNRLAALDRTTGNGILAWSQDVSGSGARINTLLQGNGVLYAGGQFTVIGGGFRTNATSVRISSGQATTWQPRCGAVVRAIAAGEGAVFVGGDFISVGGKPHSYFAVFPTGLEIVPTSVAANSSQFGFNIRASEGSQVVVERSGNFTSWIPVSTNPITGSLIPFSDPEPMVFEPRYYRTVVQLP